MELLEGLKTRRSVRLYDTTKKIPHEDIEKILDAVSYSPSAHNKQPWEFLVIEDAEKLASLRTIQPWTSFAKNASCAIIVCSNTDEAFHRDKFVGIEDESLPEGVVASEDHLDTRIDLIRKQHQAVLRILS